MNDGQGRRAASDRGVYVISVVADLSGMHPQTLRMYERRGLIEPKRTSGNSRRYSDKDLEKLLRIHQLTHAQGLNLEGVRLVMDLEERVERLQDRLARTGRLLAEAQSRLEYERRRSQQPRGVLVRLSDVKSIFGDHARSAGR
ncbi:MAG: heat shock protein transcriptional repressor HspR [Actinomycetota bacterium]